MKKITLNFIVDCLAFTGFAFLTTTGVLLHYLLPPGSGQYSMLWGMDRHQWGTLHFWLSIAFFAALSLHLVLHWRWITSQIAGRKTDASGFRLALGFIGALTLTALAVSPLLAPVEISVSKSQSSIPSSHPYADIEIRGSMTLMELEEKFGVPVDYLLEKLNLPAETPKTRKLGQLRKTYGFDLNTVRKIIGEFKEQN
jgi:uncharacterized protein DUF4405